jgi:hypothetical protein
MLKFAALLLLSSFAAAQTQTQLPDLAQTRLHTLGGWKLRIENRYSAPIVAMYISYKCPATAEHARYGYAFRYDHLLHYGGDPPIAPGRFLGNTLPTTAGDCDGGVEAVVFADGHSDGDPEAVQDIYRRRVGVSEGIAFSLPLIEQVSLAGAKPADIAKTLRDKSKTDSLDTSKSSAEKEGERYVLAWVAWLLEKQHDFWVPSDVLPGNQPGIEEIMQARGITREQAHGMVLKRELEEWNADLQGNLDPPPGK